MGLNPEDLAKVPKWMGEKECYKRIYDWHKKYGKRRIEEKHGFDYAYSKAYLDFVDAIPSPSNATQEDMDFVFAEVIAGLMEWSYHEEDGNGIKMAAYAHFALNKKYPKGFHDEKLGKSRKASNLFAEFSYPMGKKKYKYEEKDT
ncbi:MAG: hypothetical protein ABIK97_04725 [candidate division WOR-3 bacterium]